MLDGSLFTDFKCLYNETYKTYKINIIKIIIFNETGNVGDNLRIE